MGGVQSLVLQAWMPVGRLAIDRGAHRSPSLALCTRATGLRIRVCTTQASGVGALAADWGAYQLGFKCVLGLLIWCSLSRGQWGGGGGGQSCCSELSEQSLSASIFSFSFQEIPPFQAPHPIQTSTWPLIQPSLALSQESCSRHCTQAGAFIHPVSSLVPGT